MSKYEEQKDILKLNLLEAGGVDNWIGYGDAFSTFLEGNTHITEEELETDKQLQLNALENAGVDNWSWYGESLDGYIEYCEYLDGLDENEEPMDFYDYKNQLEAQEKEQNAQRLLEEENERLKAENEQLKQQEELRKIIKFPHLYDYISERHSNMTDEEKKDIYDALIHDETYNIFSTTIVTNEEFKTAKSAALASGCTKIPDFKSKAQEVFTELVIKNNKIDLLIDLYLVGIGKKSPKYISYIKLGANANLISKAHNVAVVSNNKNIMTIEPDRDMNTYLMKLNKLPEVYNTQQQAETKYKKDLKVVKDKLETQEINLSITKKKLGL